MAKRIKMIGFDLDGTILHDYTHISQRVLDALEAAHKAGVVLVPSTGRPRSAIPERVLELPFIRYAATSNGAVVYDLQEKKVVHSDCFDKQTALDVLAFLEDFDCTRGLYLNGLGYNEEIPEEMLPAMEPRSLEYVRKTRAIVPSLADVISASEHSVEKFTLFFTDMEERQRANEAMAAHPALSVASAVATNLEGNTATCGKGVALLALGGKMGISQSEIMGIGDGINDLDMLQRVGHSVAMGNGAQEAKDAAKEVTLSIEEDGAAVAIEAALKLE